ncbi:hypothetical protein RRG08_000971 [Elysia crispata]|uniref:Uncharacterized protein n=1 Tax=Elysia crispata TaxID=231223 RepID=A0AAE1DXK3_9GAST|nr:hypothetical protein RRG08_000971 [Elysia crispata]
MTTLKNNKRKPYPLIRREKNNTSQSLASFDQQHEKPCAGEKFIFVLTMLKKLPRGLINSREQRSADPSICGYRTQERQRSADPSICGYRTQERQRSADPSICGYGTQERQRSGDPSIGGYRTQESSAVAILQYVVIELKRAAQCQSFNM